MNAPATADTFKTRVSVKPEAEPTPGSLQDLLRRMEEAAWGWFPTKHFKDRIGRLYVAEVEAKDEAQMKTESLQSQVTGLRGSLREAMKYERALADYFGLVRQAVKLIDEDHAMDGLDMLRGLARQRFHSEAVDNTSYLAAKARANAGGL